MCTKSQTWILPALNVCIFTKKRACLTVLPTRSAFSMHLWHQLYLFIMCEICWSCYDSLLIIRDDMLIVAMNNSWSCITTVNHTCWSCMIYVDHPIIRLLIKCDICWSCYDAAVDHGWNLLIMPWKPIDHTWWYVDRSYEQAVDHTWCIT